MPDFGIVGIEQDRRFAIQRDTQQCTVPLKVMPGNQEPLSIGGPLDAHQSTPSFQDQITRFARRCRAELNLSYVGTKYDYCSFRTIGGQAPIDRGIDLGWGGPFSAPHIELKRFPSSSLCDAVHADRRWQACTLHVPDARVFQD